MNPQCTLFGGNILFTPEHGYARLREDRHLILFSFFAGTFLIIDWLFSYSVNLITTLSYLECISAISSSSALTHEGESRYTSIWSSRSVQ